MIPLTTSSCLEHDQDIFFENASNIEKKHVDKNKLCQQFLSSK